MKWWFMGPAICLLATVSGCNGATPAPDSTQPNTTAEAVPAEPVSPLTSPASAASTFTSPVAAPPSLGVVPTPSSAEQGTVTGILMLDNNPEQPVPEVILYLGSIVNTDGVPALASLDKQLAPRAQTTAAGQFIFEDVPTGEYALILDMIVNTFVLHSPTGEDLIIQVDGGQIVDLGELRYNDLPISLDSP